MTEPFTAEEEHALDEISRIDEWERDALERAIRGRMFDGVSFRDAVVYVLANAERPEDPEVVQAREAKRKAMAVSIANMRAASAAKYKAAMEAIGKNGI